jgi:hypothetical protein
MDEATRQFTNQPRAIAATATSAQTKALFIFSPSRLMRRVFLLDKVPFYAWQEMANCGIRISLPITMRRIYRRCADVNFF